MTTKSELKQLTDLANKQVTAEQEITRLEGELKEAKLRLARLAENQIPELMDSLGLADFTTTTGAKVVIMEKVRASITKDNATEAFVWLRAHGHGKLIKNQFTLQPTEAEANSLRNLLKGQNYAENPTVHPQTLSAFVRDLLEKGQDVPLDLFSVFRQRVSKIELS